MDWHVRLKSNHASDCGTQQPGRVYLTLLNIYTSRLRHNLHDLKKRLCRASHQLHSGDPEIIFSTNNYVSVQSSRTLCQMPQLFHCSLWSRCSDSRGSATTREKKMWDLPTKQYAKNALYIFLVVRRAQILYGNKKMCCTFQDKVQIM